MLRQARQAAGDRDDRRVATGLGLADVMLSRRVRLCHVPSYGIVLCCVLYHDI